jgi:hypothetical protein
MCHHPSRQIIAAVHCPVHPHISYRQDSNAPLFHLVIASLRMSSLPSSASTGKDSGLRVPSNGKTIYHRPLNRTKTSELSQASFAFLFSEMVAYAQKRVKGIQELEHRYVYLRAYLSFRTKTLQQGLTMPCGTLDSTFRATP